MSADQVPGILAVIARQFVLSVLGGMKWPAALAQAEGEVLALVSDAAEAAWGLLRPRLESIGKELEALVTAHVQPGFENVTSEDTAREKAGADLVKSGDALPEVK